MKKYPWVPIACFVVTLLVSYVAGVSGKASPLAACHSKANVPGDTQDKLVIKVGPAGPEVIRKYGKLHQAFQDDFFTLYAAKLKPTSELFVAAGAKTFGPLTVQNEAPQFLNSATLGWKGGGNHNLNCCHEATASVGMDIPMTWRFEPIHPDVPAAGTVVLNGSVESSVAPVGTPDCPATAGPSRKTTHANYTVTYSKSAGGKTKTMGTGGSSSTTALFGGGFGVPGEEDLSDAKLPSGGTKKARHDYLTGLQFESSVVLLNEVFPHTVQAKAESAVAALAEIRWRIDGNDFLLNDFVEGKNDKTDLGN
jgi:hypothetical protein